MVTAAQQQDRGLMRIALMPSAYAPQVGGVEVLTARLAQSLRERGHVVEVWAPRHPGDALPERETHDGIDVRRFVYALPRAHLGTVLLTPWRSARTLQALRRAVHEFRPTHLHVQCFSANGAYATALSRLTGLPLVVTLQGETVMDDRDIYDRSTTLRSALRQGLRQAGRVTGCSEFTLDDATARFGLSREKSSVIFNGVDPDEAPPRQVALPFERYLLGLGRVVHKKGFDLLLDAFAQIAGEHPDVGLVIAGEGGELEPLKTRTRRLGLDSRVHFPGRLDRSQVAWAMSRAEAFVMPSRVEPFGIVALEGWRADVPVVVSSRGGAPEFVQHERTGLVADPHDTAALSRCLHRVLSDDALRDRLRIAGRAELPDFTWAHLAQRYEDVYALAAGSRTVAAQGRSVG